MQVEGERGKGDITSIRIISSITSITQFRRMEETSQTPKVGNFHISKSQMRCWRCKFVGSEEESAGPTMPNRGQ